MTRDLTDAYVARVVEGRLRDPTLTFQLKQGFRVLAVVHGYDPDDRESLGHAAVIQWTPGSRRQSRGGEKGKRRAADPK